LFARWIVAQERLLLACVAAAGFLANACGAEFMAGADISALTVLEKRGAIYRDNAVPGDAIDILRDHGVNWVRLRLFVNPNPATDPFIANDLDYTIALAQRAKAAGAKVLLDFHYSDTWADPGKQFKPAAWASLPFKDPLTHNDLVTRVHDYTRDAVAAFHDAGAGPEMVQIGNEIANGFLWEDGRLWRAGVSEAQEFDNLAELLSAGINGAKAGAGAGQEPLIMIHHDKGAQWSTTSYYFNRLIARNVDFDVIGYSYYPKWHYNPSTGAGDIGDLQATLINTANTYDKPVVLVETGFASRGAQFEPDYEFDVSAAGQQQFLEAIVDAVQNVPNGLGQGVFWWYPEARPTSGLNVWEGGRYGLFDQNGNLLPAAAVFEQFIDSTIPGDYNNDGSVDPADYVVWRDTLGESGALSADGNGNLAIDAGDYDIWRANFSASTGISGSVAAAAPEPATATIILAGMLAAVRRRMEKSPRRTVEAATEGTNRFRQPDVAVRL
jgi:arabinogalactan endo-1,4-beta-galactosidase